MSLDLNGNSITDMKELTGAVLLNFNLKGCSQLTSLDISSNKLQNPLTLQGILAAFLLLCRASKLKTSIYVRK